MEREREPLMNDDGGVKSSCRRVLEVSKGDVAAWGPNKPALGPGVMEEWCGEDAEAGESAVLLSL
jgi:hypothetical protein